MKMYEINYTIKQDENSTTVKTKVIQIPADNEQDDLVKLGLMHHEDRVIEVLNVVKPLSERLAKYA